MREAELSARAEDGMVLPLSVIVLTVIIALASAVVWSAVQANDGANQQQWRNAALAAAQAGMQAADYRLTAAAYSSSGINTGYCFTTTSTAAPSGSPAACTGQTESFGAGSYTYRVTPINSTTYPLAPADCTGWPVTGTNVYQYCITSTGKVNGVSRRVQERVVASPPLFPVNGITSLSTINFINTLTFTGNIWGNGAIQIKGNTSSVSGTITYTTSGGAPRTDFTCSSSCSETSGAAYPTPAVNDSPYAQSDPLQGGSNNDAAINWGVAGGYNPATRVVSITPSIGTASNPVLIPAGIYNFCEFALTNTAYLQITGRPVIFYIDSPYRTGSGCASGTGDVSITNTFTLINPYQDPTAFQILAYGNPTGGTEPNFKFTNTVGSSGQPLYANFYAPFSAVAAVNKVNMVGSILAGSFSATNTVTMVGTGGGSATAWRFAPTATTTCTPKATTTGDPNSGCY